MNSDPSFTTSTPTTLASHRPTLARAQRLVRTLVFCVVATLTALVTKPAAAIVFAPMCGPQGETIAAPPIGRAAREVLLAPKGCEEKRDSRFETRQPKTAPLPVTALEWIPRLPPVRYQLPPPPRVLTPIESTPLGERVGFARGIERPPR